MKKSTEKKNDQMMGRYTLKERMISWFLVGVMVLLNLYSSLGVVSAEEIFSEVPDSVVVIEENSGLDSEFTSDADNKNSVIGVEQSVALDGGSIFEEVISESDNVKVFEQVDTANLLSLNEIFHIRLSNQPESAAALQIESDSMMIDYSMFSEEEITSGLTLYLNWAVSGGRDQIKAGDGFSYQFPNDAMAWKEVTEELILTAFEEDRYVAIGTWSLTTDGLFTFEFMEDLDAKELANVPLEGSIALSFALNKGILSPEYQMQTLFSFAGVNYALLYPAIPEMTEIAAFAETEESTEEDMETEASTDTDSNENVNYFQIIGELKFDEVIDDVDWSSILRPLIFRQTLKLTVSYQDPDGNIQTMDIYPQSSVSGDPFYLSFIHDGEGGGNFTIYNVPDRLLIGEDLIQVTNYHVEVVFDDSLPYYQNTGFDVDVLSEDAILTTLEIYLKTQDVTIDPKIVGTSESDSFDMRATYTKLNGNKTAQETLLKDYAVNSEDNLTIRVPYGIKMTLEPVQTEEYQFSGLYTVKTEGEEDKIYRGDTLTIEAITSDFTIEEIFYAENASCEFKIYWIDNNSENRPEITQNDYQLQYYNETTGQWELVTSDVLESWGAKNTELTFTADSLQGKYAYTKLPVTYSTVSESGEESRKEIRYRVVPKLPYPERYMVTESEDQDGKVFTYREIMDYHATVNWKDNSDYEHKRPTIDESNEKIQVYRNDELFECEVIIEVDSENPNKWNISIPDIPRYSDENEEYDYVIKFVNTDPYSVNYRNTSGNYGSDTTKCHNGGTINQLITGTTKFQATKAWLDDNTAVSDRPVTTVTLWRYAIGTDQVDPGVDAAYESNQAARVVCHVKVKKETEEEGAEADYEYEDVLLSYDLTNTDVETIVFNSQTVEGLPRSYSLPLYDEQGRKYVYFVRETIDGENYTTVYDDGDLVEGAQNQGTITNVRREKAAISIDKIWQCPTNLSDIDGAKVVLTIKAPDPDTGEMTELTVYSSEEKSYQELSGNEKLEAQTLSGFSSLISSLNLVFYVNICNESGKYYNMEEASAVEIAVIDKDGNTISVLYGEDGNGSFILSQDSFKATSEYIETGILTGGMKQFRYTEKNTIVGNRTYIVTKQWSGSISQDEIDGVDHINFQLKRRSTKNGQEYENVTNADGTPMIVPVRADSFTDINWSSITESLPKYDNEGYAYQYEAYETTIVLKTGESKTPSQLGWGVLTYPNDEETVVVNYRTTGGDPVISIFKEWEDNGDLEQRKPVTVHIYKKEDIAKAVEGREDADYISLEDLSFSYYEQILNTTNGWRNSYLGMRDVASAVLNKPKNEVTSEEMNKDLYLILEYKVGNGTAASYTVGRLKMAVTGYDDTQENKLSDGTVENGDRAYSIEIVTKGSSTKITNIRTGKADLKINKNWNDNRNEYKTRPQSIKFQIYRDGIVYLPEETERAALEISCTQEGSSVELSENGIITVVFPEDTTSENWTLTIDLVS